MNLAKLDFEELIAHLKAHQFSDNQIGSFKSLVNTSRTEITHTIKANYILLVANKVFPRLNIHDILGNYKPLDDVMNALETLYPNGYIHYRRKFMKVLKEVKAKFNDTAMSLRYSADSQFL